MNSSTTKNIRKVLTILRQTYPLIAMHEIHGHDPFHLLVAVILSQRARDSVTVPLAVKLFAIAPTPKKFVDLPVRQIEEIIKPIGFYHQKAAALHELSKILIEKYDGHVPSNEKDLLSLPHVGRKTANIMLTTFFHTPQIAVDIHVHRITNRLGWIHTKTPEVTEKELTKIIPKNFLPIVNQVFVAHGQTICLPRNPKCVVCPIEKYCMKII
ncbi:MAG TPA: endonuclease III [Patescibacteria group bacterium]|nr:endonuclease III [Patescibacteria group bacterium]